MGVEFKSWVELHMYTIEYEIVRCFQRSHTQNMIYKELDLEITAYQMISSYLQYVHNTLNK